uniref:Uncharacterized protein n=1 Tax=Thermogemmatispora argillosa TaxID=2045280 RepID=A0A455T4E1_9CHLR|nr:hypothetical protein KTA_30170 [Thermogemmatispora argillosa]
MQCKGARLERITLICIAPDGEKAIGAETCDLSLELGGSVGAEPLRANSSPKKAAAHKHGQRL